MTKNAETKFIQAGMKGREMRKAERRRNWLAVQAHHRKGGAHTDRKKEANKRACRKQVNPMEVSDD